MSGSKIPECGVEGRVKSGDTNWNHEYMQGI